MLSRRRLLALGALLPWLGRASAAHAGEPDRAGSPTDGADFEVRDLSVGGDRRVGQRFTLLVPRHDRPAGGLKLLVLLHGLGETGDPTAGVYAWLDRYGLRDAYRRLRHPPLQPVTKLPYWPPGRLDELNTKLARCSFRGMAIACPYTPDVYKAPSRSALLDDYASWLADVVLPRARSELGLTADVERTSLDGCSLGGYVGIEVFLRKPEIFGAWGTVQGALGAHRLAGYAERLGEIIGRLGPRPIHVETSLGDVFHDVNVDFSRALEARGVPHDLRVGTGPHNQPWLRESGTIEMLLWHDRLGRRPSSR